MRNIRLLLAYDGTNYAGWQVQPNGASVQSAVAEAIRQLTQEDVRLLAAGRTDAGVHALGQVAGFRTESRIPCEKMRPGLQSLLPSDIVVRDVAEVHPEFHATYSARSKRYRYVIHNGRVPDPFLRNYTCHVRGELDAAAMHEAAQVLVGRHDFRSFESHFPNKATSVRTVTEASVVRREGWAIWSERRLSFLPLTPAPVPGEEESGVAPLLTRPLHMEREGLRGEFVCFDVVADGFLYNMVRAIAGTLLKVGTGRWTAADVGRVLESRDRSRAGETAPAHGLYLVHVDYPEHLLSAPPG